ncbi:MAG: Y-family DNA polymerase [Breznakibacter sp.]|nr:Y-family DNA polymerase [Breznakibacter sp.]
MFGLLDCNNFYASCERVFRPDLNGKPVVVLSNNDGCVIARSNEAKAVGVPMGAPAFQYHELFKQHNVAVFSANFALYGDMSMRVMKILASYCPKIEIYSIDEAFVDLNDFPESNLQEFGQMLVKKIYKSTGIPVSIGFAPTKTLSKVANRIAKKYPKETLSSHVINSEVLRVKALKWLAVEDVWGIGRQHSKRLQTINVKTAYDFTQLSEIYFKRHMSIVEERLKQELMGIPSIQMEKPRAKKSIATTRTFERNYTTFEQLKERIVTFAISCAEKLRKQKSCSLSLMVFVNTNRHRDDQPQYNRSYVVKLPFATNSNIELAKFALYALEKIFVEGYSYKKAGVVVMDIKPENEVQQTIFENSNPKHKVLMKVVDKINGDFGTQKVRLAAQDGGRKWKMNQERLSPRYTTVLSDIIDVKV